MDPAEVTALSLELAPLRGLQWQPLQERIEALAEALRGGHGVSAGLVLQLRQWAAIWPGLHPDLRAFYLRHAAHPAGEAAIWHLFYRGSFTGPLRGQLERLWVDDHGCPPSFPLVPSPPAC